LPIAYPHTLQSRKLEKFTLQANLTAWKDLGKCPETKLKNSKTGSTNSNPKTMPCKTKLIPYRTSFPGEDEDDEGGKTDASLRLRPA